MGEVNLHVITMSWSFEKLSNEAFELYLTTDVPVLDSLPEPVEFYRKYVAANRPVIIKNAISNWPAIQKWNINFFREQFGSRKVTATVTPNGYADAVKDGYFVLP